MNRKKHPKNRSKAEAIEEWLKHLPKSFHIIWRFAKERQLIQESKNSSAKKKDEHEIPEPSNL